MFIIFREFRSSCTKSIRIFISNNFFHNHLFLKIPCCTMDGTKIWPSHCRRMTLHPNFPGEHAIQHVLLMINLAPLPSKRFRSRTTKLRNHKMYRSSMTQVQIYIIFFPNVNHNSMIWLTVFWEWGSEGNGIGCECKQ